MSLEALRARLDDIDDELIDLLARRAGVVREVQQWKAAHGIARFDAGREAAIRRRLLQKATALGLDEEAVSAVVQQVVGKQFFPT